MASKIIFPLSLLVLSLFNISVGGEIAVYWGQNADEGSLLETCASGNYNIVIIGFLTTFGGGQTPVLNLAGHCDPASNQCTDLSYQIRACKSLDVKVLLSIGGAEGSYYLSSADDAKDVAKYVWDNYLGGQSESRPLGDESLDGIDFYIQLGNDGQFYDELANALSAYSQEEGQKVYLSASPRCEFPDFYLKDAIKTGLFDYIWVQFYNNPSCDFSNGDPELLLTIWLFNWASIQTGKLFLGLPASSEAATGFIPPDMLSSVILRVVKQVTPNYGGVMLWSKYYDNAYNSSIKSAVAETYTTSYFLSQ